MKQIFSISILCLFASLLATGAPKFWIGPQNGNWSDRANWSDSYNGAGGATLPGSPDSVVFRDDVSGSNGYSLVHVDVSPTIYSMGVFKKVTLYASTAVELRLLKSFDVGLTGILKDSTCNDVSFKVVFNGATQSKGIMSGQWVFEGGVTVNHPAGNGAGFIMEAGSKLTVLAINESKLSGIITFKNNTSYVTSDATSLIFSPDSKYILEGNLDAAIPNATWSGIVWNGTEFLQGTSSITITGKMDKLKHLAVTPYYRDVTVNLPEQATDASLQLPDGTTIDGYLSILNTNNLTLTLLAAISTSPTVKVGITSSDALSLHLKSGGDLSISQNCKVAMATATGSAPATNYNLNVINFRQYGGNFSLQDFNEATGTSNLGISGGIQQQNGTFITNSTTTSTAANFNVTMNGPYYYPRSASWIPSYIDMSSGTIDNVSHTVTLIISQSLNAHLSVELGKPLMVGKLELMSGSVHTSETNILTIANPEPQAVIILAKPNHNYIDGPVRRSTNSSGSYMFPTGHQGDTYSNYSFDSCVIVPSSAEPSMYQAAYINKAFNDLSVTAPLKAVSNNRYWNISRLYGSEAKAQLFLQEPVPGAASTDALVASNYVNSHWVAQNGSLLMPGNASTGSVLSKQLSDFGYFTFGFADPASLPKDTLPNTFSGLSYKYYEGVFNTLPDFNMLIPISTGNSSNIDLNVRRAGVNDDFAIIWEGYINISTPGSYTFETMSDDGSKLYFNSLYATNSVSLVDNDGVHYFKSASGTIDIPAAGRYPITFTFFEKDGAEGMQVFWSGPGFERQLIPDAAFMLHPAPANKGLNYKYYEGDFNTLPDFNSIIPVMTGTSKNVDIGVRPAGVNDRFAFLWEGYINIPVAGNYIFETLSDDGSKIYFNTPYSANGSSLVSNDGVHAPVSSTGKILIPAAGRYPISITYFEKDGGESMQVYWTVPGSSRQLIPDSAFGDLVPPATCGLNYKYYEGDFNTLPDFNNLTPVKTGVSPTTDISQRPPGSGTDHFAFLWQGNINIPVTGTYTFETVSDDGSKLYFNTAYSQNATALVTNDGLHAPVPATGNATISSGIYPISITYFQKEGGEAMQLYWSGPGIERQLIPVAAFCSVPPALTQVNAIGHQGLLRGDEALIKPAKESIEIIQVYPNPFTESFRIDFYNTSISNKVSVDVLDLSGRLFFTYKAANMQLGNNTLTINPDSKRLLTGIYLVRLNINGTLSKTIKLIKGKG
jgi:hypothetical protein